MAPNSSQQSANWGTFLFKTPQRTTPRSQLSPYTMEPKNKTQVVRFEQQTSSLTESLQTAHNII